jgi:hypothetical protein
MSWGLTELAAFLTDLGVEVVTSEADQLVAALSGAAPEEPHPATFEMVRSRGQDEQMLLIDVTYPFTAPKPDDARLAGALLAPYFVLGRTEVDDDGSVHHRYATVVDAAADLPVGVLTNIVSVLNYEQLHYGDYLEAVCVEGARLDTFAELVRRGEANATGSLS